MPKRANVVIDDSSDEEIMFVLGKRTVKSMHKFLEAISWPFNQQFGGEELDEETSKHEAYLWNELCTEPGNLDISKITDLLKDEKNHESVMLALACLGNYDLDLRDAEDTLDGEDEVKEFRRIWKLLGRWDNEVNAKRAKLA